MIIEIPPFSNENIIWQYRNSSMHTKCFNIAYNLIIQHHPMILCDTIHHAVIFIHIQLIHATLDEYFVEHDGGSRTPSFLGGHVEFGPPVCVEIELKCVIVAQSFLESWMVFVTPALDEHFVEIHLCNVVLSRAWHFIYDEFTS